MFESTKKATLMNGEIHFFHRHFDSKDNIYCSIQLMDVRFFFGLPLSNLGAEWMEYHILSRNVSDQ